MPPILVTGAAGFIGFHTSRTLLERGHEVVGLDIVNDYYDPSLKELRLAELRRNPRGSSFRFERIDLADDGAMARLFSRERFSTVVHLAAQAGVRYSLTHPHAYVSSNMHGFLNVLEGCRHHGATNLIYASSSSVYGLNQKLPFSEADGVDHPMSLYAASKRANELMAHTYSHLYRLPTTGLRFFTVYGPWGRPDMAMFLFGNSILDGKPLSLFNGGEMWRDFTYVDDVVESIIRLTEQPSTSAPDWRPERPDVFSSEAPFRIFNIGNHSPVKVGELVETMARMLGKPAIIESKPMQAGDVLSTCADVDRLAKAVDFAPRTSVEVGVRRFLDWLIWYRGLRTS